jgi:Arc/MetJ-type ribon-helix-helix transcriptional regulator
MKLSVSLPDEDVEFLDAYAAERGFPSRSAVVHKAVRLLKSSELSTAYEDAWDQWATTGEADAWEATAADGLQA